MSSQHVNWVIRAVLGLPALGMLSGVHAQEAPAQQQLQTVVISATALNEDPDHIAAPFSQLSADELLQSSRATLGDTLNGIPGVHSDTFGGGSSRPVIRGQGAPRVKVLSDSASLLDASDISPDHAVTVEPMLIDRIEVLRGPATLLYGSGAIGGVVNVLDRKIPESLPEKSLSGTLAARAATVSDERAVALELTGRAGERLALHLEGAYRDADDYRVPDWHEPRVDGSRARSANLGAGLSWVSDNGFLGLAYSYRNDDYGLPGHSHEYEGCHPHGSAIHCGEHEAEEEHDHDHEHAHEEFPVVDLVSKRVDLRGELRNPLAGIEKIRLRASHTDYRHDELEEDEISTTFLNKGVEGRIEVQHTPLGGWRGVAGLQYSDTKFSALGEEAFIPVTRSRGVGLFVVEHFQLDDAWHFEVGARQDWQKHRPQNDSRNRPAYSGSATSFSGAAIWEFAPDYHLTLSMTRSQRLPHAEELYARGVHLASNTYECGLVPHPLTCGGAQNNAPLRKESSNNIGISLRRSAGSVTFDVGGYYNKSDNYIYAHTLDQYEDFRLIKYTQHDASFRGLEGEITWQVTDRVAATVFGDTVRASLDGGGNLPRIPAARYGTRLQTSLGNAGAQLEYFHVNTQSDIADHELRTPGYDMLNLTVSYSAGERYTLYVRGSNLLDEQVWNHASFLANVVPLPGRSLDLGVRLSF